MDSIRLRPTPTEPATLEVTRQLLSASALVWRLSRKLPGLTVIAKKSWALTDDFEAYFVYEDRLFLAETPFVNVRISLLGQPADEELFAKVERAVAGYTWRDALWAPVAIARYFWLPFDPSRALLQRYGIEA